MFAAHDRHGETVGLLEPVRDALLSGAVLTGTAAVTPAAALAAPAAPATATTTTIPTPEANMSQAERALERGTHYIEESVWVYLMRDWDGEDKWVLDPVTVLAPGVSGIVSSPVVPVSC